MKNELLNAIMAQANFFLKHAGEFYPFGCAVDNQHQIKLLSVYFGNDYPPSQEVVEQLETAIVNGINNQDYLSAAIGLDVMQKNEKEDQASVLRIIGYEKGNSESFFYNYYFENGEYTFYERP